MANRDHIQRLNRLVREIAAAQNTDVGAAVGAISQTDWHVELAAYVASVPAQLVRDFCDLHAALTGTPPRAESLVNGKRVGGVQ
jgi:hypothetical protein